MSKAFAFKANTKRDSRVELLRLFACFSVLVLHFKPGSFVGGHAVWSRVFVTCLCTDAVGIFLLISGFFFFGRQGYGKRLSGYAKKILLPTLAYTLFVALVFPLLLGEPVNYPQVAAEFAKTLFTWNPVIHNAQHLWYMYLYGLLVLAYPLLHWIKRNLLTTDARKLIFLMGIPAFLAANDFSGNRLLHAQMVPITVFIPGCLFVLAGGVLYEHRAKLQGKVIPAVLSLLVYAAAATVRSLYMQTALNTDIGATHLFGWYTGVGFVCSAALAVFILCMNPFESAAINALASNTLEVYILHVIVSEVITLWGWKSWVVTTFLDGSEGLFQYLKFAAIYPLLVFVVCSIAAAGLKAAGKMLKRKGS